MPSSGRRSRAGRAAGGRPRHRGPRRPRRPRARGPTRPAAAGAPRASRRGSAGSASRPSTTSAGGWRCRRPRRTASPRSTRCSRRSRGRRSSPTSATTSPAGSPGRRGSATTSTRALGPEGEAARDGRIGWLRSPCLGLCDLAPAAHGHERRRAPPTRQPRRAGRCRRRRSRGSTATRRQRADAEPPLPPGRRPEPPAPAAGRRRRPGVARRLPGARRLRRPAPAIEIGPEAVIDEVTASKLIGRGGAAFPTGPQVGRRRRPAGAAPLPRLQRRRVRARHVQGPRAPGGRPVRGRRGDDDRGVRDRRAPGLPLHPRRVPGGGGAASATRDRGRPRRRAARRGHPRLGLRLRHRAPARRRRLHLRRGDGALRVDRGQARRAAQQAAVPGRGRAVRQADGRQQRRDARQRPAHPARWAARPTRAIGTEGSTGPKLFCLSGHVARPGHLRGRVRGDAARPHRPRRRRPGRPARSGRSCSAARPASSSGRTRSTCRSPSRRRAPPAATLGSGVVMVFDETVDLVDTLRRIAQFFRDESCGQCVPCRVGTVRQEELLARLAAGSPRPARATRSSPCSRDIGQAMRDASICGLGQTASSAIESALRQPELVAL